MGLRKGGETRVSWQTTYNATTGEYGKEWVEDEPIIEEPISEQHPTQEQQAVILMRSMVRTATTLSDDIALSIPDILPTWEELLERGEKIAEGVCLMKDGQCYRVVSSGGVLPQQHQPPGGDGMLAIYRPIDREHAGTLEDPIPWVSGMDCKEGKYYSHKGKIYLCTGDMSPCVWEPGGGAPQWEEVLV